MGMPPNPILVTIKPDLPSLIFSTFYPPL